MKTKNMENWDKVVEKTLPDDQDRCLGSSTIVRGLKEREGYQHFVGD